jgi:hypothetical protein
MENTEILYVRDDRSGLKVPKPLIKVQDANSLILNQNLIHNEGELAKLYRPLKFRGVYGSLINRSVPAWADEVEIFRMNEFAEVVPISRGKTDLPSPTVERSKESFRLYSWGAGVDVLYEEVTRAQQMNAPTFNIALAMAAANQRAAETKLENIAANGDTASGLAGLYNLAGVSPVAVPGITGSWGNAGTSALAIVEDFVALVDYMGTQSKEIFEPTNLVITRNIRKILQQKRTGVEGNFSAWEVIRTMFPEIQMSVWEKGATAGAGSTSRMVFFNNSAEVLQFYITQELTNGPVIPGLVGYQYAQSMRTGGAISRTPEGVLYIDNIDAV